MSRRRVSQVVLYTLLIIGALIALLPMLWMLSASFMPTGEANTYPPHLIPSRITFSHYTELFTRLNLGRYLVNSILISVTVTAVSLVVMSRLSSAVGRRRPGWVPGGRSGPARRSRSPGWPADSRAGSRRPA